MAARSCSWAVCTISDAVPEVPAVDVRATRLDLARAPRDVHRKWLRALGGTTGVHRAVFRRPVEDHRRARTEPRHPRLGIAHGATVLTTGSLAHLRHRRPART